MTKAELAALLDGMQYDDIYDASDRIEQHKEAAKAAGLVIIYAY